MSVNPFTVGTRRVGIYRQLFSMDTLQNRTKGYFNTHLEISLDYFYLTINISIWIFNIFNCTIIHDNFNCSIIVKITCSRFSIYCKIFSSNYISSLEELPPPLLELAPPPEESEEPSPDQLLVLDES